MANFTCLTCHVLFEDADNQREHYKTDWHRYNLKRKIVELQPVTKEVFKQKVDFQTQKKDEKVSGGKISTSCQICNKKFSSEKAFENHVKSKKHRDQEAKEAKKGNTADCNTMSKFALSKNKHFQLKQYNIVLLEIQLADYFLTLEIGRYEIHLKTHGS